MWEVAIACLKKNGYNFPESNKILNIESKKGEKHEQKTDSIDDFGRLRSE